MKNKKQANLLFRVSVIATVIFVSAIFFTLAKPASAQETAYADIWADKTRISPGESVVISWSVGPTFSGSCMVSSNFGVGVNEFSGSKTFTPSQTTAYTYNISITCFMPLHTTASNSVTVEVLDPNAERTITSGGNFAYGAGLFQVVPSGYGLTAIGYGSDDTRCFVYIKTAPVGSDGTVNFNQVSGWQNAACPAGGGTSAIMIDYQYDNRFVVGWSWGASTDGGSPGNSSYPYEACYYQEYAPLNDINNRSGWAAQYDGTCNERLYQQNWLKQVVRAPYGRVIVAVGLSLANDASMEWMGMQTRPVRSTLTVTKTGTGSGTVTSNPAGINCGSDCLEDYGSGTVITLTASAASGSTFASWSGEGCSGTGTCTVSMTQARNVTATFNSSLPVCPSLPTSYPSNSWDRVWCDKSFVSKLADTPDESTEQFSTNWGTGTVAGIRVDDIGFRSGRTINFPYTGVYTFSVGSDDGIKIWIDGALALDKWVDRSYITDTFTKTLTAGNHQVRIDYYEYGGDATVSFGYTPPPQPDFTLNSSGAIYATVLVGGPAKTSTDTTITVTPFNGFSSNVNLSVQSANPALTGATYNFSNPTLTSSTYSSGSTFNVVLPATTAAGLYTITIKGEDGGLIRTVPVYLNVETFNLGWKEI